MVRKMDFDALNENENDLIFEAGDIDGFHIKENTGKGKIYIYFSELPEILQKLRIIEFEYKKHSPRSKNTIPINDGNIYKTLGNPETFKEYNRYIHSNNWKDIRNARLQKDNNRCRNCGSVLNLQVHHKNYNSFGNENINDIITLCDECHNKIEKNKRKKRKGVITEFS